MAADPLYWLTALDLNFEGADASTTITDISPTPKTPSTVGGAAQLDTAQFKTGSASLQLVGGTSDYVSYATDAGYDFGTGDFCVEFWWRPTTSLPAAENYLAAFANAATAVGGDYGWAIRHTTAGKINAFYYNGTTQTPASGLTSTTVLAAATWYHVAFTRTSGVVALYINGVSETSAAAAASVNTPASRILQIGRINSTNYATGFVDGLRITKGNARYTANFTTSTALFESSTAGTANVGLTSPVGTLSAKTGARIEASAPVSVMSATTGAVAGLTSPAGYFSALSHDSTGERSFAGTAPMGVLSAKTGASASTHAPVGTLLASVTVPISVQAELVSPMGTLLASGTVAVSVRAELRLTSAGTVVARTGGRVTVEGPAGVLNAVAAVGVLARFANSAPAGVLTSASTAGIVVRAELIAPMLVRTPSVRAVLVAPKGYLTATARAVVTVTYEAYAVNLKHDSRPGVEPIDEVTRYTNYPFNQIVRYQNKYFGVANNGIYELTGTTDVATAIPWVFKTAMTDDRVAEKKTVRALRFSGRVGPAVTITLFSGESGNEAHAFTTPRDATPQNHREKLGRGIKGRYYAIGVAGSGVLDLDGLEPEVDQLTRKL